MSAFTDQAAADFAAMINELADDHVLDGETITAYVEAGEFVPADNNDAARQIERKRLFCVTDQLSAIPVVHQKMALDGKYYFVEHVATPPGGFGIHLFGNRA